MKVRKMRKNKAGNVNWDIPFEKLEHIQSDISADDFKNKLDDLFFAIRPHCGNPKFSQSENDLLYAMLDEYTSNLSTSTVFGIPNVITLKKQITLNIRPIEDIISDTNKLIDFVNIALS